MTAPTKRGRHGKGGRPSKGQRRSFMARVPADLADAVVEQADAAGLTYSDWIAEAIAAKAGHELPTVYARNGNDNTVQEEFPMQTAS